MGRNNTINIKLKGGMMSTQTHDKKIDKHLLFKNFFQHSLGQVINALLALEKKHGTSEDFGGSFELADGRVLSVSLSEGGK